jgi:hypothetical protein
MAKQPKPTATMRALRLKKRPMIIYADQSQVDALKALAARTGKTQQELLRAGLAHILATS